MYNQKISKLKFWFFLILKFKRRHANLSDLSDKVSMSRQVSAILKKNYEASFATFFEQEIHQALGSLFLFPKQKIHLISKE